MNGIGEGDREGEGLEGLSSLMKSEEWSKEGEPDRSASSMASLGLESSSMGSLLSVNLQRMSDKEQGKTKSRAWTWKTYSSPFNNLCLISSSSSFFLCSSAFS